jgi:hypothetical protein
MKIAEKPQQQKIDVKGLKQMLEVIIKLDLDPDPHTVE